MSETTFIGTPRVSGALPGDSARVELIGACPILKLWEHEGYSIHEALYSRLEGTHKMMRWTHGPNLIIAVSPGGSNVGIARRDLVWVQPRHRGHGLGPQIVAALFMSMGAESWQRPTQLTEEGFANRKRAYRVLVERGAIEEK